MPSFDDLFDHPVDNWMKFVSQCLDSEGLSVERWIELITLQPINMDGSAPLNILSSQLIDYVVQQPNAFETYILPLVLSTDRAEREGLKNILNIAVDHRQGEESLRNIGTTLVVPLWNHAAAAPHFLDLATNLRGNDDIFATEHSYNQNNHPFLIEELMDGALIDKYKRYPWLLETTLGGTAHMQTHKTIQTWIEQGVINTHNAAWFLWTAGGVEHFDSTDLVEWGMALDVDWAKQVKTFRNTSSNNMMEDIYTQVLRQLPEPQKSEVAAEVLLQCAADIKNANISDRFWEVVGNSIQWSEEYVVRVLNHTPLMVGELIGLLYDIVPQQYWNCLDEYVMDPCLPLNEKTAARRQNLVLHEHTQTNASAPVKRRM